MCRFVLYLGEPIVLETILSKPVNSLINQSYDAEERDPLNGDGFGVAWYTPDISPEPAVFKSASPAWSNRNLLHLGRVTRSGCVLGHVRAGSAGIPVSENNCHPFLWGKLAFMHNGGIGDFPLIRRALLGELSDEAFSLIQGETDSEHLFALFLDCWMSQKESDPVEAMAAALDQTIEKVVKLLNAKGVRTESQFNLAVSDGIHAAATRCSTGPAEKMPTLYWHEGRRYIYENGECHMIDYDVRTDTVIIASEPLSNDPGWEPLAPNSLIMVRENHDVILRPLTGSISAPGQPIAATA